MKIKILFVLLAAVSLLACGASGTAQLQMDLDAYQKQNAEIQARQRAEIADLKRQLTAKENQGAPNVPGAADPIRNPWGLEAPEAPKPQLALYSFAPPGTTGESVGYINPNPLITCGGMCWDIQNITDHYLVIFVNSPFNGSRRLTVYDGNEPVIMEANEAKPGGGRQARPVAIIPPRRTVRFSVSMPGTYTFRAILYTLPPGQMVLQPFGVWESDRVTFPYRDPIGATSKVYGKQFGIEKY